MAVDSFAYIHIYIQICIFSTYVQVHSYMSIWLITGWGSKGAATARLLPYMGGGRLHTQRSWTHIYAFINGGNVQSHTHIFSMHKITHRNVRQREEMIPGMIPIVMCASMAQYGPVRPSMVQYGSVCPCMVRYPPVWPSMVQYAPAWISTAQYGPVWPSMAQYAPVWLSMV